MKKHVLLAIGLIGWATVMTTQPTWAELKIELSQIFFTGLQSSTIDSGDIDGDGDIDLVIADIFDHAFTIALNDGTGEFTEIIELPLQNDLLHPVALSVGDLDGDGLDDIAAAQLQNIENTNVPFTNARFVMLFNNGDGSYEQKSIGMRGVPSSVIITDFNQDGMNDVIVGNNGELAFDLASIITFDSGIDLFENQGNRNFTTAQEVEVQGSVVDELAFDFNDDGFLDVVGLNQGIPTITIPELNLILEETNVTLFLGSNAGVNPFVTIPVDFAPWDLDTADFNGDGLTDIAVTLVGQSAPDNVLSFLGQEASVEIMLNTGDTLTPAQSIDLVGIAYSVAAEDFDMDGDVDLLVSVQEVQQVEQGALLVPRLKLFENDNGFFTEVAALAIEEEPRFSVKDDFDGDGDTDLAVLCTILDAARAENAVSGRVYVFKNNAIEDSAVPSWELY